MLSHNLLRILGHQSWIRFGLRDRVIRALHNPDNCLSKKFEIQFFGKTYQGDFANFIDWSTYYYGAYCEEELSLIKDALYRTKNPIVFDIGANIGHHSLFASNYAKEVHSFEPLPEVAMKLHQKIQSNKINNIIVHEIGLGSTNEELPYSKPVGCNTGTGSFMNTEENRGKKIFLPIRKGDDYVKNLKLSQLDFIKMDIEGFEPQALQGLKNTLKVYRPIVFFEWSANQRGIQYEINNLFPEEYKIFNFLSNRAAFGIFNKKGYILKEENGSIYSDGNKVALPVKKVNILYDKIDKLRKLK